LSDRLFIPADDRWLWAESLSAPTLVIRLSDHTVARANREACVTLGSGRSEIEGGSADFLIPDYLVPGQPELKRWIAAAKAGEAAGVKLDLLSEIPGREPLRLTAQIGLADAAGEFVTIRFERADTTLPSPSYSEEEAIRGFLADIGRIIGSSMDLKEVCEQFAISLTRVAPAEHIAILLCDDESHSISVEYSTGGRRTFEAQWPPSDSPLAKAMESHSVALLDSVEISDLLFSAPESVKYIRAGLRSLCCMPLVSSGDCIGLALLGSSQASAFTQDDLSLLEQVGAQVAGAIANVRLHAELSRDSRERDALAGIGRMASSAIDFSGALPGITAEIELVLPLSELTVYELDNTQDKMVHAHSWSKAGPSWKAPGDDAPVDTETALRECVERSSPVVFELENGLTAIAAPLMLGTRTVGAMTASAINGQDLLPRDISFITRVSSQLAGAVHTARVYRRQQREARLRRALADLSLAVSKDLEPERVFERLADEIAELVMYDLLCIALVEPDRSGLRARFQVGADAPLGIYDVRANPDETLLFEARSRTVSVEAEDESLENLWQAGFQSFLEVSIGAPDSPVIGYMAIASRGANAFSANDLEALKLAAAQVAPYIQNAIAHEQAIELAEAKTAEAKAEARSKELERINEAKSQFLSIVSHELRTPLTSIIAYADLFERNAPGNLNEKQITQARVMSKSATHLKFLISDLLDVSRIESGNLSLSMSTFDVRELASEVAESLVPVLSEKNQSLKIQIAREPLYLHGDRARIAQVLSNIIENASKYSLPGTEVTLDVHRRKGDILLAVADEGIGISVEDQAQLFTPFFRANNGLTRTEPGTGLGLALVKKITELHGGRVEVKSEPGTGSTFVVALKAASASQAA
jgi:signal transduction histidine kinase